MDDHLSGRAVVPRCAQLRPPERLEEALRRIREAKKVAAEEKKFEEAVADWLVRILETLRR